MRAALMFSLWSCIFSMVVLVAVVGIVDAQSPAPLAINNRPIIGVYTQPSSSSMSQFGEQYVAASYVKYLESGGARVVPIRYTSTNAEIVSLFNSINGLLLPGGGVDFAAEPQYWSNLASLYSLAIDANSYGDYFPIWGTCMGFQELMLLQSNNMSLLADVDAENISWPIYPTKAASISRLFGNRSDILDLLTNYPITMNNHHYGVTPASFYADSSLANFFNVLSTNTDRVGVNFISTVEARYAPIYGTQWHPEKPLFEWNAYEGIDHSEASIIANGYTAQFFANEARKSKHQFQTVAEEAAALIYNYVPVYTYPYVKDFEQAYFFNTNASI